MQKSVYENSKNVSLESISKLVNSMSSEMDNAIKKIQDINEETHILALNAAIEASSAGDAGKGFGIVAEHMGELSNETSRITKKMNNNSQSNIIELEKILTTYAASVRGNRLAKLAFTNIDLIDRNLYERTADIRWWATEKSVVNALTNKTPKATSFVSGRLNTILKFYSIYHDLILADTDGNIIANGNPQFNLIGRNISERPWFKNAIKTKNGDEFGFESVHYSPPINHQNILTFSCKVHTNGDTNQPFIGVLGTVFNWTGLAQKIVNNITINEDCKSRTRVCIVNKDGTVLADTQNKILDKIHFDGMDEVFKMKKNYITKQIDGKTFCIGHAISPGFEGYSTGWHSLIIQELD